MLTTPLLPSHDDTAILLAIETSTVPGSIAIKLPQGDFLQVTEPENDGKRSSRLTLMIQDLLTHQGLAPHRLNGILVSHGPGSFTGLRVGIVTAKTLAYALKVPIYSIPTFNVIAHQFETTFELTELQKTSELAVVADAFRGRLFVQRFQSGPSGLVAAEDVHMESPETFFSTLSESSRVAGPGIQKLKTNLLPFQWVDSQSVNIPQATSLLSAFLQSSEPMQPSNPFELIPLYIRASAAEEKRLESQSE